MPPQRRSKPTPQQKPTGRRPKIAGRQTTRPAGPGGGASAEPEVSESVDIVTNPDTEGTAKDTVKDLDNDTAKNPVNDTAKDPESDTDAVAAPVARTVNRTSSLRPRAQSGETAVALDPVDAQAVRAGWRRVAVIAAVAVVAGVFAVVAAFRPGAGIANEAWVDPAETMEVTAAARNAIQTLYTYGYTSVDQDFDNARGVLTDSMRTEFDQTAQVTRDAVIQTKTETNAQVTDIGVKLLDGDSAELVASMNVSASNDGVAQGSAEGPLSVTMTRVGGSWLLADIRDR